MVLESANHVLSLIRKVRGVVDSAIASSRQSTLQPQQLRLLLLAKSEHAPLTYCTEVAHPLRSGSRADHAPRCCRPKDLMATKEESWAGGSIHFAVLCCTDDGFGIEMVQALDEAHAVDIVQALQPGVVAQPMPAASLDGKDRHRLLSDWTDALEQPMASAGRPAISDLLTHRLAAAGSEHEHLGG